MLPLMGTLIGYSTNWLAIKMVFRPYEEKRFFNVKVPFTPGVMAKERYVLSKKLGDTLADNIITEDELTRYLEQIDFNDIIDDFISDVKVDDNLLTFIKSEKSVQVIKKNVKNFILTSINEDEKKQMANFITKAILDKFKNNDVFDVIPKKDLIDFINSLKNNDELFRVFNNIISKTYRNEELLNKQIDELLGENITDNILNSISKNSNNIRLMCLDYVNSDRFDFFEDKIYSLIVGGINKIPLASMFGGETLAKNILPILKENILEYLANEENNEEIANFVIKIINDIFEEKIEKVLNLITYETVYVVGQKVIVEICNILTESIELGNDGLDISKIFDGLTEIVEPKINIIVFDVIDDILTNEKNLEILANIFVDKILNIKILDFVNNIDSDFKGEIVEKLQNLFSKRSGNIIQKLNISEIVEEKINTFEMKEAEDIVVGIMNKELKMITNLGGVLGFIVGFVTALI